MRPPRRVTPVAAVIALGALIALDAAAPSAQETGLDDVLARAGRYVTSFRRQLSGMVAEERYVQDQRNGLSRTVAGGGVGQAVTHRELRSDVLLVRPPGSEQYVEFRDVFEVDGRPVRDRDERLSRLFLDPSASSADQATRITQESARYNIGSVERTINTSTLALLFLDPGLQQRFTFKRVSPRGAISTLGIEPKRLPPDVWVVAYEERNHDTIIRLPNGIGDVPSRGRFWIEPATGRVLLTELRVDQPQLRTVIDVVYAESPDAPMLLPSIRGERYDNSHDGTVLDGRATYSRFRRFTVSTDQNIDAPKP